MKKKIKALLVITALLVTALGGITGCGKTEKASEGVKEINIATQSVVGYVPVYVMRDTKSLEKALTDKGYDIKVNFVEFESGPPENEAFASGQVDIGVIGNVPAISGIVNGQQRSVIGIAYNGEKTEAIIVRNDSDINDVKLLAGKRIGLVVGSIAQNYLSVLLESKGLSLSDVELVNLSPGEQQQALETKIVDAVATWEPTISKLTANGDNRILADGTGIFLGENPIIVRSEFVKENPEIVRIFLEEFQKAAKQIDGDISGYADKYAKQFLLDKTIVEAALSKVNFPVEITEEDVTDLQNTADFLYKEGLVSKKVEIKDHVIFEIK